MSKNDVLYVKDMHISEEEDDEGDEDIWDDRKLNDAYDKALKMANAEVAKRIAMSTNSQSNEKSDGSQNKKGKSSKPSTSQSQKKKPKWKPGMPCRAVYEEDGQEYEACVLTILNDTECVVKYLGYKNSEIVQISSLRQSQGEEVRARQIEEALLAEDPHNGYTSHSSKAESIGENSEQGDNNVKTPERSSRKHAKSQKKKNVNKNQKFSNGLNISDMPMPVPNLAMLMNMNTNDMPMPMPPPPPVLSPGRDCEEQAVSSMLLSWYMSGYYTGLYQGLKRSKENARNH